MQIHIRRGDTSYGPYTLAEVRTYLGDGRLQPQDEAWAEGTESWRPLVDLLAQLAARGDAPAAAPPLSTGHGRPASTSDWAGRGTASATVFPSAAATSISLPETSALAAAPTYAPGGLGARFGAMILDGLVALACFIPAFAVWTAGGMESLGAGVGFLFAVGVLASIAYNFVKDGLAGGQSLGKRVAGLMVVHLPTNQPCSVGQSALRALVMFLLNLIPYLGWLVEPIMVLAASDRRRLGDRAAGTQVIAATDYRP